MNARSSKVRGYKGLLVKLDMKCKIPISALKIGFNPDKLKNVIKLMLVFMKSSKSALIPQIPWSQTRQTEIRKRNFMPSICSNAIQYFTIKYITKL